MGHGAWRQISFFFVGLTVLLSYYSFQKISNRPSHRLGSEALDYEMPRPPGTEREYDLSGLQVIRRDHQAGRPVKEQTGAGKPNVTAVANSAANPKSQGNTSKKAANKKKSPVNAQKKQAPPSQSLAKSEDFRRADKFNQEREASPQGPFTSQLRSPEKFSDRTAAFQADEDDKLRMSVPQWRSLLMNQPTAENGSNFLSALQKNFIDRRSFDQIAEELLTDRAVDRQKLAVFLLRRLPSEESFVLLTRHYSSQELETVKPQVEAAFGDYANVARFPILSKLLYSSNTEVVAMAQLILRKLLLAQKQSSQQIQGQGRDARSPGSAPIPTEQFQNFIPALQRLVGLGEQTIAQQAQSLIDSIKDLKPV